MNNYQQSWTKKHSRTQTFLAKSRTFLALVRVIDLIRGCWHWCHCVLNCYLSPSSPLQLPNLQKTIELKDLVSFGICGSKTYPGCCLNSCPYPNHRILVWSVCWGIRLLLALGVEHWLVPGIHIAPELPVHKMRQECKEQVIYDNRFAKSWHAVSRWASPLRIPLSLKLSKRSLRMNSMWSRLIKDADIMLSSSEL